MAQIKPWLWPIALAALVILGLAYALWPRPVAVDVAVVDQGPMLVTIEDDGRTRVKDVYVVSAPVGGRMLRVEGQAGDLIEASKTVIATIEPADPAFRDVRAQRELELTVSAARAARELAQSGVRGREAELKLARQERDRVKPLVDKGILPKARLDSAEASVGTLEAGLASAQAALRQREFELKTAEASLIVPSDDAQRGGGRFAVRAPVDGQILRVLTESESVIQAGQAIVEVGNPGALEIVVDLLSTDAVKVSPGDAVLISRWGGEGTLNGAVRRIEPFGFTKISSLGIEEQRVNVIVDLTDPPGRWRRLGHGFQIDAAIVRWRGDRVTRIPIGALFREGDDWAAFRIDGGRAVVTRLEIGHMNDEMAEVLSGLKPDDQVVTHPGERVTNGVRVTAR